VVGVKHTIKSKADFNILFETGRKVSTKNAIALITQCSDEHDRNGRVAFVAGKRLGSAPVRSRSKRMLREAARALEAPWSGYDVILIARNTTATARPESIKKDIAFIIQKLNESGAG
jgi:ribonuclease P protein component